MYGGKLKVIVQDDLKANALINCCKISFYRNMAVDMNSEISDQNEQLDRVMVKVNLMITNVDFQLEYFLGTK